MTKPTYLLRTLGTIGLAVIVAWSLLFFIGTSLVQAQTEPTPRPSPTAGAYITVSPGQAVAQQSFGISVSGVFWTGSTGLKLYWDEGNGAHLLAGPIGVDANGGFDIAVQVPAEWAPPGPHHVLAMDDQGRSSNASVVLVAPTPPNTPTPSNTPAPTNTPSPTNTPTPITPTSTPTPTRTPTSTPVLVPLTPIVTASPVPPPGSKPTRRPIFTLMPTHTPTPEPASPTPMSTPILVESLATATPLVLVPEDTATSTPTPTPTSTPTATSTSTPTPTRTLTPVVDTVNAVGGAAPTGSSGLPELTAGMPETGDGWQASFLTGFIVAILVVVLVIAFLTVVLATVLFGWQYYHKRQLAQER